MGPMVCTQRAECTLGFLQVDIDTHICISIQSPCSVWCNKTKANAMAQQLIPLSFSLISPHDRWGFYTVHLTLPIRPWQLFTLWFLQMTMERAFSAALKCRDHTATPGGGITNTMCAPCQRHTFFFSKLSLRWRFREGLPHCCFTLPRQFPVETGGSKYRLFAEAAMRTPTCRLEPTRCDLFKWSFFFIPPLRCET